MGHMQTMDALTRLADHQERILAQIDRARALVDLDPVAARDPLARSRWGLTRLLREYQLFKHREIFDPVIAGGDEARARLARRMKAACLAAGQDYVSYVAQWSSRDVTGCWAEYRPAMLAMVETLRDHLAAERSGVGALLADACRARRSLGKRVAAT